MRLNSSQVGTEWVNKTQNQNSCTVSVISTIMIVIVITIINTILVLIILILDQSQLLRLISKIKGEGDEEERRRKNNRDVQVLKHSYDVISILHKIFLSYNQVKRFYAKLMKENFFRYKQSPASGKGKMNQNLIETPKKAWPRPESLIL